MAYGYQMMGGNCGYGFMGYGWIFQILIFVIFVLIIYWIIKKSDFNKNTDSPKDILKKRLVKGEITKKEFEDLLKEIEK